eukprot:snap_masked-scaffold_10-processed-gene-2.45-mRNA-1 protein AED:1.00 eAED:1.00 QI:0/0/0/0/1/1/2/0/64
MRSHTNLDTSLFDISLFGVSSSLLSGIFKLNDEILKGVCLNEDKKNQSNVTKKLKYRRLLREAY